MAGGTSFGGEPPFASRRGSCLIIDDANSGGSDDGAWHTHIAHTPALRAQLPDEFPPAGGVPEQERESVR